MRFGNSAYYFGMRRNSQSAYSAEHRYRRGFSRVGVADIRPIHDAEVSRCAAISAVRHPL
jgi:hypothetical protein